MDTKKLINKLDTKPSKYFHVEFSNASIENFKPTFGNTEAQHLYFPLPVPKGSHLKGLVLRVSKATKLKYFVLRYWFGKKHKRLVILVFKKLFNFIY